MPEEFDIVTIRLRKGDRDAMATYFHPVKYNKVIRTLVSRVVDKIRSNAANIEVNISELETDD